MTYRIRPLAVLTILVAIVWAAAIQAQGPAATTAAQGQAPSGGLGQGIKVHGHWLIEVRNPDGVLAARHEFENALIQGMGTPLLAGLLGNQYVDVHWGINLWGDPDPCSPQPTNGPCTIGEPALTVSVPMSSNVPAGTIELSASATMARDTRLWNVNTIWNAAIQGTASGRASNQFSEKTISIQVHQGQIVQIKVVFSFS